MKKLLSFALVLAMILGSVSMVFATGVSYKDTKGIDEEEAINVLTGLGVLDGYEDGSFQPAKSVKRSEMVKMIIAALNLHVDENGNYVTRFTDVASNKWYAGYILYATTLGIVEGTNAEGTLFNPDGDVTYDQAIAMVMRALGYNEECLNGEYPSCYVNKAVGLGALKNVPTGNAKANRASCAQLIFNVLTANIGKVGSDGKWEAFVNTNTGLNNGVDNMLARLGAEYDPKQTPIVVDPDLIKDEDTLVDLSGLLGHEITVYKDGDKIVAVYEVLTEEIVGKLKDGKLDGTKTTANFKKTDATTYKNGAEEKFEVKDDTKYTWVVKMVNGKVDKAVTVLTWEVTDAMMATKADLKSMTKSTNPSLGKYNFPVDEDDKLDEKAFTLVGVDSLDDVEVDNVLYVYATADKTIAKLEVGTKVVEGEVTKLSSKNEPTVDGVKYALASKRVATTEDDLDVAADSDEAVKLYLDIDGKVFAVKDVPGAKSDYALFLKYQKADSDKTIDGSVAKAQFFTAEGEIVTYELDLDSKKNKVDPETLTAGDVVTLVVNDDDEVTVIETVALDKAAKEVTNSKKGVANVTGYDLDDAKVVFKFDSSKAANKMSDGKKWSVVDADELYGKTATYGLGDKNKVVVVTAVKEKETTTESEYVLAYGYEREGKYYNVFVLENGEEEVYKVETAKMGASEIKKMYDTLYTLKMKDSEVFTEVTPFTAVEGDWTFKETATPKEDGFTFDKNGNLVAVEGKFSFAEEVVVYVKDGDDWTVEDVDYLEGLEVADLVSVTLFDTVKKGDEKLFNTVIVVLAD